MLKLLRKIVRKMFRFATFHSWLLLGASIFAILTGIIMIWLSSLKIPDFQSFDDRKVVNSTKIYDRTGEIVLYDLHQDFKRTNISFEKMGTNIKNATVAIEDSEFYNHNGIRVKAIARAFLSNLFGSSTQGGSTITQQLVKNTLLTKKKTYGRKIKEWVLSIKVERVVSKEKILEHYLNEAPYGGAVYGIEEASKTYFGKSAETLSLAEAAYLAAIPQSPTALSPFGKNVDKLENRKNLVLFRMKELGFITPEEYETARMERVNFIPRPAVGILAPHFVFFIKEYLEQKYGSDAVEMGGLRVITTLDYTLQEKAETIVKEGALENEKVWDGENAALVAIDPKTGQILTMVGSRDYFDKEIDGNYNVAIAKRQPGSSFKPFIYANAFNKGLTPNTVLFDLPTEFQTTCNAEGVALPSKRQAECYMPNNYDGKFRGPMNLRNALAQSINVPAVKLFYLSGVADSLKTAENLGITTLADKSRYGLTLVIGGGEVTLLDMTSAYGVFANNGTRNQYTGILKIEDLEGDVLEAFEANSSLVIPKNTALIMSNILSDNVARVPTFGRNSALEIAGHSVAVKTGTTNNNRDAWTIGYTPSIAVGVWAGNNDNTPMKKGGSAVAGPIWNKFMREALVMVPTEGFEPAYIETEPEILKPALRGIWQGGESFFIDKISKKLATTYTPKETLEEKVVTEVHSILYWVDKKDILGPRPEDPGDDPQYSHWEYQVQKWWNVNKSNYKITLMREKPSAEDDIHSDDTKPVVFILEPKEDRIYKQTDKIKLLIKSSGRYPLVKIDVFVNNTYLGSSIKPFSISFIPEELDELRAENEIRVIAYDSVYNRSETTTTFKVE